MEGSASEPDSASESAPAPTSMPDEEELFGLTVPREASPTQPDAPLGTTPGGAPIAPATGPLAPEQGNSGNAEGAQTQGSAALAPPQGPTQGSQTATLAQGSEALAPSQGNAEVERSLQMGQSLGGLTQQQALNIRNNRAKALARRSQRSRASGSGDPDPALIPLADRSDDEPPPVSPPPLRDDSGAPPKCVICQWEMTRADERLALPCAHVFHKACIEDYASCKGIELEEACPFKCRVGQVVTIDEPPAVTQPGAGTASPEVLALAARASQDAATMFN